MERYPSSASSPRMNSLLIDAGDWFKELGRVLTGQRTSMQEFAESEARYKASQKEESRPLAGVLAEKSQVGSVASGHGAVWAQTLVPTEEGCTQEWVSRICTVARFHFWPGVAIARL